jgi:hypothetical protein
MQNMQDDNDLWVWGVIIALFGVTSAAVWVPLLLLS